jgi:hypothetical protein
MWSIGRKEGKARQGKARQGKARQGKARAERKVRRREERYAPRIRSGVREGEYKNDVRERIYEVMPDGRYKVVSGREYTKSRQKGDKIMKG